MHKSIAHSNCLGETLYCTRNGLRFVPGRGGSLNALRQTSPECPLSASCSTDGSSTLSSGPRHAPRPSFGCRRTCAPAPLPSVPLRPQMPSSSGATRHAGPFPHFASVPFRALNPVQTGILFRARPPRDRTPERRPRVLPLGRGPQMPGGGAAAEDIGWKDGQTTRCMAHPSTRCEILLPDLAKRQFTDRSPWQATAAPPSI